MGDTYFQGKYRSSSHRAQWWDYTWNGCYFVTINTQDRYPWFGEVVDGHVELSEIGNVVNEHWLKIPSIRPYVWLDEWVIMPDHMHGILGFMKTKYFKAFASQRSRSITVQKSKFRLQADSLGSIIGQFKSTCTKRIRSKINANFAWHNNYHDRIVRDRRELQRIRRYITNNPKVA